MTSRAAVVEEAESWLGTPYHHQGRVKGAGVDCLQILIAVYGSLGLVGDVDPGNYTPDWHFHREVEKYLDGIAAHAVRLPDGAEPKPGDLALFQFGRCVSHAAIVVQWPLVIHAYHRLGVVYADVNDAELKGRFHSAWSVFEEGE